MMKRPAAKKGSYNESIEQMKKGMSGKDDREGEEDSDGNEDCSQDEEEDKRDKGKAVKFHSMKKSLPPHIIDLYDREADNKASPRAFRSLIVNTLFKKLPNGRYELQDQKPMFTEAKKIYERKYGADREHGYPKTVLKGLYFGNSETAFQAAVECGDVYKIDGEDGGEFWGFRQVEKGRERRAPWPCTKQWIQYTWVCQLWGPYYMYRVNHFQIWLWV